MINLIAFKDIEIKTIEMTVYRLQKNYKHLVRNLIILKRFWVALALSFDDHFIFNHFHFFFPRINSSIPFTKVSGCGGLPGT